MLRDYKYDSKTSTVIDVLKRFGLNLTDLDKNFSLLEFEDVSPDSFMFTIRIGNDNYYLYAEDYVPSLDYIKGVFNSYIADGAWDFVMPEANIAFDSASPVDAAEIYKRPEDANELMKYAVDSGYDFVFLAKRQASIGMGGA